MSNITSKLALVAASLALVVLGTGCRQIMGGVESESMSPEASESDGSESDGAATDAVTTDGVKADTVTNDGYHEEGTVPAT